MEIALVNGERAEPFAGGRGNCPQCGSPMVAKCGPRVLHHWAHFGRRNCDPWWETETPWHRAWKALFPEECREVSHIADDGEIHRADIKTPTGIVVEIQNSPMSDTERISREQFYRNLVWLVNGAHFKNNFDFYHILPDPTSELAQDLIWGKAQRHMNGANRGMFVRLSEARVDEPTATKATNGFYGWLHSMHEIESEVRAAYRGHVQYDWVRPRRTWLDAKCPVYIDFGEEWLARLETYDETGLRCVRLVSKRKFVHDVMVEARAEDIATRFYPLPDLSR
jgi:hypothetical protein